MIKPKKSLGQNFLKNKSTAKKIVGCLGVTPADCVLEIGPGTGILTEYLIYSEAQVYAVDIDKRLTNFLSEKYHRARNLMVIHSDIIEFDPDQIDFKHKFKAIGNLPYHLTSSVLQWLCDHYDRIDSAVLTIQKEVAARITASVDSSDYSSLTIFVNNYCDAKCLFDLSSKQFHPPPKVTSTVIKLDFFDSPVIDKKDFENVRLIVKNLFKQKRKMAVKSLVNSFNISREEAEGLFKQIGLDIKVRPQNISLEQYNQLSKMIFLE